MDNGLFSDSEIKSVADLVYETCGIVFRESNLAVLASRLNSKIKEKRIPAGDYVRLLRDNHQELLSFIDFVTTNFTSFFRNPRQFELLESLALPEIVRRNDALKTVRIWSAGCSTGEEPYTIAMVVNEFLENRALSLSGWSCFVTASDISLESLFTAKEGKFPKKSVEKVDLQYLAKYFRAVGNDFIIKDSVKKNVRFDYHNLINDNGIRDMDAVFCRNVLIYFDEDIQRKVLANLHLSMRPGAFLFVGHSESLIGITDSFQPQTHEKGIVYVRR